jgi:hypothetical protein
MTNNPTTKDSETAEQKASHHHYIRRTGLTLFLLILLATGMLLFRHLSSGPTETGKAAPAVLPTDAGKEAGETAEESDSEEAQLAALPTPTAIPTLTPLPSATPLPTSPPTPMPVTVELTGPNLVPTGLPAPATWVIRYVDGPDEASFRLSDLGGAMLAVDVERQAIVQQLLAVGQQWEVAGVIDPNMGQGTFEILVETADFTDSLTLHWSTADITILQQMTIMATLNGLPATGSTTPAPSLAPAGFMTYDSPNYGLSFLHPEEWLVVEDADSILIAPSIDALSQQGNSLLLALVDDIDDEATAEDILDHLLHTSTITSRNETLVIGNRSPLSINGTPAAAIPIEIVPADSSNEGEYEIDPEGGNSANAALSGFMTVLRPLGHRQAVVAIAVSPNQATIENFSLLVGTVTLRW